MTPEQLAAVPRMLPVGQHTLNLFFPRDLRDAIRKVDIPSISQIEINNIVANCTTECEPSDRRRRMMFGFSDIPRPADTARENQTKYGLATLSRNPYFMCHYLKVRRKSSKRGSSKGRVMVFKGGNMVRAGTQLPTTTLGVFLSIKNMANQPWFTGISSANHVISYRFNHAVSPAVLNHHCAQSNHGKMSSILLNLDSVEKTGQLHLRYDAKNHVKRDSMAYCSGLRTVDQAVQCAREMSLIAHEYKY